MERNMGEGDRVMEEKRGKCAMKLKQPTVPNFIGWS